MEVLVWSSMFLFSKYWFLIEDITVSFRFETPFLLPEKNYNKLCEVYMNDNTFTSAQLLLYILKNEIVP